MTQRSRPIPLSSLALPVAVLAIFPGSLPVFAKDRITGPVDAEIVRAIDGDTLEVRATIWIGQELTTHVRIRGIDAPEEHARCSREKTMADAATRKLAELAQGEVRLTNVENDKYGGRVIADVLMPDGTAVAAAMLSSGLVRPYDGGERRPWCEAASG